MRLNKLTHGEISKIAVINRHEYVPVLNEWMKKNAPDCVHLAWWQELRMRTMSLKIHILKVDADRVRRRS